ncbi:MAG: transcriptional regulator NrdR [Oscillospiraceae bacterium]|nr:transcriptional regulator NrdR [Oscillospiraceae bacterium]
MRCPDCGYEDSRVIDSRPTDNKIRRRRECLSCKSRFTTYEIVENIPLMVIKKNDMLEPFDRQKLIDRLLRATIKRPVKLEALENMVEDIVSELKNKFQREVTSEKIGELVLRKLKDTDHVAYIRFASVYRDFSDVESFISFIADLSDESNEKVL